MKHFTIPCIALFLLNCFFSTAQTLTVSSPQLNFGSAYENAPDSLQITVYNNMGHDVNVTGIKFYNTYGNPPFSAAFNGFTIQNASSFTTWIKFSPQHNIFHNFEMVIENDGLRGYVSVDLVGQGKYSNTYYDSTENKSEEDLKNALHDVTGVGYISLGYSPARDYMFMVSDNQMVNGQGATQNTLESVYTGAQAVGYIDRADCQTTFSFNTEHTWPQSLFSQNEPMRSDLHHLFPTDDASNNYRANNPFGVVTNPSWSVGGSKGISSLFEPRDVQKGATARAMMYFVLRYQNYNNFFTTQENILRTWHQNFPPTQIEQKRNHDIDSVQHNRNPFVDYPQFIDRITSISNLSVAPVLSSIDLTQDTIVYGFVQTSVSNIFHYVIVNNGNVDVHFTNFALSHPGILSFQSGGNDTTLAPGEALGIDINFFTTTTDSIHGWLTFNTDVPGLNSVTIPIYGNDSVLTGVREIQKDGIDIFPNPVNKSLRISYSLLNENSQLNIFDVTGKILISENIFKNSFSKTVDVSQLSAGIYFLKIQAGEKIFFRKFVKD